MLIMNVGDLREYVKNCKLANDTEVCVNVSFGSEAGEAEEAMHDITEIGEVEMEDGEKIVTFSIDLSPSDDDDDEEDEEDDDDDDDEDEDEDDDEEELDDENE
jgi:hypothetical protein